MTVARSVTGKLRGPWKQAGTLLTDGGAHGTVFRTFEGRLMMVVSESTDGGAGRVRLVELADAGDTVRIKPVAAK